ncbi:AAA family ATPase [bacterium]|nr:AAA family ATPase [bacterium]
MINKIHKVEKCLNNFFIERKEEIHGLSLSLISGANALFIGPPGTGKTLLVDSWQNLISDNTHFSWLLHKFMTPDELFGPVSLEGLKNERFIRNTKGKLPEATTCFLDEIYKCNAGSLNALLSLLNEKKFYNDGEAIDVPLISAIGASNELPDESDNLDALDDRFSLRYYVQPVREHSSKMKIYNNPDRFEAIPEISIEEIMSLREDCLNVEVPESIADMVVTLIDSLKEEGITITDRTFKASKKLLQAEALFNKRTVVQESDVEVLKNSFWRDEIQQPTVYKTILKKVAPEKHIVLELYENSQDIYETVMKVTDPKLKSSEGLEAVSKLKDAKKDIHNHLAKMKEQGLSLKEVKHMEKQLDKWIMEVFNKQCGVDFGQL